VISWPYPTNEDTTMRLPACITALLWGAITVAALSAPSRVSAQITEGVLLMTMVT
jgi:hypothetical protein